MQPFEYTEEEGQVIIHFTKSGKPVLMEISDANEFMLGSPTSLLQGKKVAIP